MRSKRYNIFCRIVDIYIYYLYVSKIGIALCENYFISFMSAFQPQRGIINLCFQPKRNIDRVRKLISLVSIKIYMKLPTNYQ